MNRWAPWIGFVVAAAAVLMHSAYLQPWTLDDAYISMRYADNFAQGHGLVFNPGEYCEGYTTFLWVILLSIGSFLGAPLDPWSKGLGLAFGLGTLALLAFGHRIAPKLDPRAGGLAAIITGTCAVFTVWVMSSMEVPLVAFFCTLAVLLHFRAREIDDPSQPRSLRSTLGCAVACVLATMSRPEAVLVFLVLFADRLILSIRRRDMEFFVFGLTFSAIYLPYFAWRFWYYGFLLPNTFYVKVGDSAAQVARGWKYLGNFVASVFTVASIGFVSVLAAPGLARRSGGFAAVAVILALHTAYVISVGGDVMPAYRFFATVLPLAALLGGHLIGPHLDRLPAFVISAAMIIAMHVHGMATDPQLKDRVVNGNVGRKGKVVGMWLREHVPPDTLVATSTAGSIPYFSKLPTIDMLGLNDVVIAHRDVKTMGKGTPGHEKGDGKYVMSRKPDLIQFGSASGSSSPGFLSDREIAKMPEFQEQYVLRAYGLPERGSVQFFVRKDREAALGLPTAKDKPVADEAPDTE